MQSRGRERGHGEDHVDGRLRPHLVVRHLQHLHLRYASPAPRTPTREGRLLTSRQLAQRPVDGLVRRVVLRRAEAHLRDHVGGVGRHGDLQLHVLRGHLLAEVRDHLDVDLQRRLALRLTPRPRAHDLLVHGQDAERQVDVLRHTVLHQLELAVWGNERDRAVLVELAQAHAAVERAVVDLHARALAAARALRLLLVGDEQLVVQAEAALGHARQVRLHHDLAHHLAAQHRARLRDQQVHALQRVDEDLVLAVRDALAAPTPYGY